jgi:hypothetical protein
VTELVDGERNCRCDVTLLGRVARGEDRLPTNADDVVADLRPEIRSSSSHDDGGTLGSDTQGDSPSDAGSGTDDQYDLARQPTCDNFVLARHWRSVSRVNAVGHGLPGQRPSATNSVDQLSAASHGLLPDLPSIVCPRAAVDHVPVAVPVLTQSGAR